MKWQVQESHLAGEGYEPWQGTGPPAAMIFHAILEQESGQRSIARIPLVSLSPFLLVSLTLFWDEPLNLQAPESNRGDRPYESQLGASRACIALRVTKGRVELPSPDGHDVLSVACLPVAPLGRSRLEA